MVDLVGLREKGAKVVISSIQVVAFALLSGGFNGWHT
jgi:hypothetical protein